MTSIGFLEWLRERRFGRIATEYDDTINDRYVLRRRNITVEILSYFAVVDGEKMHFDDATAFIGSLLFANPLPEEKVKSTAGNHDAWLQKVYSKEADRMRHKAMMRRGIKFRNED